MVRAAGPNDAAAIARIHVASWQAAYAGILDRDFLGSLDLGVRTSWWEGLLAQTGARSTFVGDIDGEVAGFCLVGPSDDEGWGEVSAIYVAPEHWGAGLGHDLIGIGELRLAEQGYDRASLWVLEANERARNFYARQGWVLGRPIRLETIGGTEVTEVRYEKLLGRS